VQDEIVALAKLAAMDDSARDLDRELREIPQRIESMREDVATLEVLLSRERTQLTDAVKLKDERAGELQAAIDGLSRAKAKAAKATNLREVDAAEREVESNRRLIKERELEVANLTEAITQKQAGLAEREAGFEEARTMLAEEEASAKTRIAELEAQRAEVLHGRDDLLGNISGRNVKRYDRARKSKGDGVVIIEDGTCSGCRMALPAQLYIEVQKGLEVIECPQCRRIVIHKSLVP